MQCLVVTEVSAVDFAEDCKACDLNARRGAADVNAIVASVVGAASPGPVSIAGSIAPTFRHDAVVFAIPGVEIACNDVGSWPCIVVGILVDSRHVLKLTRSLVSVDLLSARLGMQVVHRPLAVVHCQ